MNTFSIIQNFFTQMTCHICDSHFEADGIELVRQEPDGIYVVSVFCHTCNKQIGLAMVGVETHGDLPEAIHPYKDPELTDEEIERLSAFKPIESDDVINAHTFFKNLDNDWMKFIPEEIRTKHRDSETESPEQQSP